MPFRGVINLARAPYHPRPIGVGPHPHPNTKREACETSIPILGVGGALARPRPPDHCSAPIQPPNLPNPSASPPALLPELPELMKKRAPSAKPAKTECQPTCPAPRAARTRQKCSQNDHFRTQKSSSKAVRMSVFDDVSRRHKSRTRTLPPPAIVVGPHPHPNTPRMACEAETPTSGCGGRGGMWGLLRRGMLMPHGLTYRPQTRPNRQTRLPAYMRCSPSCRK